MDTRLRPSCSLLVLLSFACAPPASPVDEVGAGAQPRQEAPIAGYHYLTFVTGGARPDDELPMIVGLHYSSARPEAIVADFDQIDFPARIILPRGRYPRRQGYSWFPSSYGELGAADQGKLTFQVKDELSVFIDAATKKYPTAGKPVLAGTSYGGDLSYLIAIHHPDQVSAAFPVAARFPTGWMPGTNACRPNCPLVYAMHGDKDETVPIDGGRRAAERLVGMGYRVEFHEYKDVAHDFSTRMKSDFTENVRNVLNRELGTHEVSGPGGPTSR